MFDQGNGPFLVLPARTDHAFALELSEMLLHGLERLKPEMPPDFIKRGSESPGLDVLLNIAVHSLLFFG